MTRFRAFLVSLIATLAIAAQATDLTVGGTTEPAARNMGKLVLFESAAIPFASNSSSSNDTHNVINIPAYTLVLGTALEVSTASTDTGASVEVGDGSDANGWIASSSITTATNYVTTTENGYSLATDSGKLYTVADTIDIRLSGTNTTTSTGIIKVRAWGIKVN